MMQKLIKNIKENKQDFEFYPTSLEMVKEIWRRIDNNSSLLDVGCGNGNIFNKIESLYKKNEDGYFVKKLGDKFGIEKSEILINQCASDIVIVGTDFDNNTLIDKQVDIVFSNPPYSQFENWAFKIIKEAYCKKCFLILPRRWQDSDKIAEALKLRDLKANIIWSGDFLDAERKARAVVDIVQIDMCKKEIYYSSQYQAKDPFDSWFKETFNINAAKKPDYSWQKDEEKQKEVKNEIVKGDNLVKVLCDLYRRDLAKLGNNYKMLGELDAEIFEELNISIENLMKACKEKIKGLKRLYWQELFNNFDKITSRLTYKKRQDLLDKLNAQISIDFEESNIYAVVIWVIKNANKYFDEQLVDIFKSFCEIENIKNYKSNHRTWKAENWRWKSQKDASHYTLELRVIKKLVLGSYYEENKAKTKVNDIFVIADNLGFDVLENNDFYSQDSEVGTYDFKAIYKEKEIDFLNLKIFKNGNGHFKFNQEFMKKFNVEASRLLGWIKSAEEAAEEFDGNNKMTKEEAREIFKKNFLIITSPKQLLLN